LILQFRDRRDKGKEKRKKERNGCEGRREIGRRKHKQKEGRETDG